MMILPLPLLLCAVAQNDRYVDDIEHRAFNFFWEQSEPDTGFTKDRASNFKMPDDHTVSSCAAIGFALSAYPIGVERHWIDRKAAHDRTKTTLEKLNSLYPNEHGWLYHFVDWKTGERQWNCEASSIDTSICLAGMLIAKSYWKDPEFDRDVKRFTDRIDWNWMLTKGGQEPDQVFLCMGWKPESGFINATWSNFCELNMIYIQAYGLDPSITTAGWNKIGRDVATDRGHTFLEGGPLFMHEMSNGFYDFGGIRDQGGYSYWVETREAALANRAYCIDDPRHFKGYGPDFWGLSACDTPTGYDALGTPPDVHDDGTITPTSAIAAMPYIPGVAKDTLKYLRDNYGEHYGRYGFPNGMCPNQNWYDPDVIGIDLGMMMLAVEDYRTGLPWKMSNRDPNVRRGFERIGFHPAKDANDGPLKD